MLYQESNSARKVCLDSGGREGRHYVFLNKKKWGEMFLLGVLHLPTKEKERDTISAHGKKKGSWDGSVDNRLPLGKRWQQEVWSSEGATDRCP